MKTNFIFIQFGSSCFYLGPASCVGIDVSTTQYEEIPATNSVEVNYDEI